MFPNNNDASKLIDRNDSKRSIYSENVSSIADDDEETGKQKPCDNPEASSSSDSDDTKNSDRDSNDVDDDGIQHRKKARKQSFRQEIARSETRAVWGLKLIVLFILFAAAAAVSAFAYWYTHTTEVTAFDAAYDRQSQQILDTVQLNAQHKLEAMGAIAMQIQAHAINSNSTWPFVTMPFFEDIVMSMKSLTDAYGVYWFPIVKPQLKEAWENYSVEHRFWIDESYAAQRDVYGVDGLFNNASEPGSLNQTWESWFNILWGPGYKDPRNPDFSLGIAAQIFKTRNIDNASDTNPEIDNDPRHNPDGADMYFFPQWQAAPLGWYYQSSINLDYAHYTDFFEQTKIITSLTVAAFGQAWTDNASPGYLSTVLYPIMNAFHKTSGGQEPKVVGLLAIDIYWQAFLKNILAPNSDQLYVVIENICNQSFTYILTGTEAEFVGEGDQSEVKFQHMAVAEIFGKNLMSRNANSTYVGRLLYDDYCPYTFTVSASQQMEDHYVTKRPVIYAVSACLIFLFTSLVFVTYDCLVERRQRLVLNTAARSDAIVASLFPKEIKQQLYHEASKLFPSDTKQDEEVVPESYYDERRFIGMDGGKNGVGGKRSETGSMTASGHDSDHMRISPMASLYPATTIMFAGTLLTVGPYVYDSLGKSF